MEPTGLGLRTQRVPFKPLLDLIPHPVIVLDERGTPLSVNQAMRAMVGLETDEPIFDLARFVAPESRAGDDFHRATNAVDRHAGEEPVAGTPWLIVGANGEHVLHSSTYHFVDGPTYGSFYAVVVLDSCSGEEPAPNMTGLRPTDRQAAPAMQGTRLQEFGQMLRGIAAQLDLLPGDPSAPAPSVTPAPAPLPKHRLEFERLTAREREVLQQLRCGLRVASIAKALSISDHTVRNHIQAVFRKVGVHSQAELLELLHSSSTSE